MLVPYDLIIEPTTEPERVRAAMPTLFADRDDIGGWMTLAVTAHRRRAFVALILLDDSAESTRLRAELERRYHDLDRITGDALTVLTDARPPDDWFRARARDLGDLPTALQSRLRLTAGQLQTPAGREQAAAHTRALLGRRFTAEQRGDAIDPPALVLLDFEAHTDGEYRVLGAAHFSLRPFTGPGRLIDALRLITEVADDARRTGQGIDAVASRVWSWSRWSLRWIGALNGVTDLLRELRQLWLPRA